MTGVGPQPFSAELTAFIVDLADAVELIDVLVLLAERPQHWFAARAIAQALATNEDSVERRLRRLRDKGLARTEDHLHCYAPRSDRDARLAAELLVAYRSHRVRVIEVIFARAEERS